MIVFHSCFSLHFAYVWNNECSTIHSGSISIKGADWLSNTPALDLYHKAANGFTMQLSNVPLGLGRGGSLE